MQRGPYHADRALVRRLLAGDQPAFEHFFAAYFPVLFRFALKRLGHDAPKMPSWPIWSKPRSTICRRVTATPWNGSTSKGFTDRELEARA
ncbi:MAG TPA: hypothetical protein VGB99_09465, partial [Acidobacteriota bacterium]